MIKGSKGLRCDKCGVIVAWSIPTGEFDHGIKRIHIKERPCCKIVDIGFARHYRCKACCGGLKDKYDKKCTWRKGGH